MISSKILRFLFVSALTVTFSAAAHAQATRTWVSGVGDDANPCSRTAPCKTFAGAISKTAAGGEISVLDPGGFGTVTITKAITINGTGTLAGILAANTNGVNVNAGPNDTIILRDLSINGANNGLNGIRYIAGGTLMVDHCSIYGFRGSPGRGIDVAKTGNGNLKVINTIIENVLEDGIRMTTTSGLILGSIDNSQIMNCATGIEALDNVRGTINNSKITANSAIGVKANGGNSTMNLEADVISFNGIGIRGSSGSAIRVSDSVIGNNTTGVNPLAGTIDSFQGNSLIGNITQGAFSTTTSKQ
jgi:hypothetical protein